MGEALTVPVGKPHWREQRLPVVQGIDVDGAEADQEAKKDKVAQRAREQHVVVGGL